MTGLKQPGHCRRRGSRRRRRIIVLLILNIILVMLAVPFFLTKDKAPKVISDTMVYEVESGTDI